MSELGYIAILLLIMNVLLGGIFYTLYKGQSSKQENFEQSKETLQLMTRCDSCMKYVQEWWQTQIMDKYNAKQMTDKEVQDAYNEMTETLIWLVAPCILGWWNDSPTMLIQQARGLAGLKNVNVQVKTWWSTNIFTPNHFNDEQFNQVRTYLLNQFNSCVDASTTTASK